MIGYEREKSRRVRNQRNLKKIDVSLPDVQVVVVLNLLGGYEHPAVAPHVRHPQEAGDGRGDDPHGCAASSRVKGQRVRLEQMHLVRRSLD